MKCWGYGNQGQLGNNASVTSTTPVDVANLTGITRISVGGNHTCAVKSDATLWCWGDNPAGQLGTDDTTPRQVPSAVVMTGMTGATQVAAGWNHTCALLADKTVACFGRNADGQLGDGTDQDRMTPAVVQGLSNVTGLVAGESHTCARIEGGDVRCWGRNDFGQLGDGTMNGRMLPAAAVR